MGVFFFYLILSNKYLFILKSSINKQINASCNFRRSSIIGEWILFLKTYSVEVGSFSKKTNICLYDCNTRNNLIRNGQAYL